MVHYCNTLCENSSFLHKRCAQSKIFKYFFASNVIWMVWNVIYLWPGWFGSKHKSLYWRILFGENRFPIKSGRLLLLKYELENILQSWAFAGKLGWHFKYFWRFHKSCTHQIITERLKRVSPANIQIVFIHDLQNSNVVSTVRLSHKHKKHFGYR